MDSTPQEHFFVTLEYEVARLDAFVKVRGHRQTQRCRPIQHGSKSYCCAAPSIPHSCVGDDMPFPPALPVLQQNVASQLRSSLAELQASISHADLSDSNVKDAFMDRAKELSNEYLHLEK